MNIIQSLKNYLSHQTTIPSLKLIKTFPSLFLNQPTHVYVVDEVNVIHPHYWIRCGEHFFPDYMLLDFCEQFEAPITQIKQIAPCIQFNLNNLEYNSYYYKQYIVNYKLDGITIEKLLELFNQEDIEFCQYLIKSPIIENHQSVLQELIKHKNPEIRKLVPQSEFVTEEQLQILIYDNDLEVKKSVALSKNITSAQLQILTHDNKIRTFLDEKNKQSTVLIKNVTSIILEAIDNNDNEAITRFLKANHEFDLPALATYPHLTQEQVQLLMDKGGSKTRAVLSCSPKITKEQFQTLLSSKDSLICQMATNSCHIEEKDLKILMHHSNLNVVIAVAKSHFVTERILRELMNHENEQVRVAVASSPNVTSNILKKLVLDSHGPKVKSTLVLEAIAASSHSNAEILFTLINESDFNVRKNTVNNPNANNRILKCFLNDKSTEIQNVAKTLLLYQQFTK